MKQIIHRHYKTIPYAKIEPFLANAITALKMKGEIQLAQALGLTSTTMNSWKRKGKVKVCYPLAIKTLLADKGFKVYPNYTITKESEDKAEPSKPTLPPLTRHARELTVRALVASLARGDGVRNEDLKTTATVINYLLDSLLGVEPSRAAVGALDEDKARQDIAKSYERFTEHASVGTSGKRPGKTLSEAIEDHARKAEALGD